jgi:hypothetical protein
MVHSLLLREVKLSYYSFLRKLKDIVNGLWTGYPPCCIAFFVRHDDGFRNTANLYNKRKHFSGGVGYIRCPACVKSGYVVKHLREGGWRYRLYDKVLPLIQGESETVKHPWHKRCKGKRAKVIRYRNSYFCTRCNYNLVD